MKKTISAVILAVIITALLSSCTGGISVPYYTVSDFNKTANILSSSGIYDAYRETVEYYGESGDVDFSYEIYYEKAENTNSLYNICEIIGDYRMYAHEGNICVEQDDKIYVIIQAYGTYYSYISDYTVNEHPLDSGAKYQLYSKSEGDMKTVAYYADITAQMEADLYEFNLFAGERIISTYVLYKNGLIKEVKYEAQKEDVTVLLAKRSFEYLTEKEDVFANLPTYENIVTVDIVFNFGKDTEKTQSYTIPSGYYVGFDTGNKDYTFYYDSEMTEIYSYSRGIADEDFVVYAK